MSITDELRKYVKNDSLHYVHDYLAIADRIDAEHQKALDEWKAEHGQMWLKGYAECHAELLEGNETLSSDLESCGWIRLPVDADGVPIHIGDVMEGEKIGGGYGEPFEVIGYVMSNGELEPMDEHKCPRKRRYLRHHHEPTVEDVMVEFATDWESAQDGEDKTAVLKEYAAKFQLRGEDE